MDRPSALVLRILAPFTVLAAVSACGHDIESPELSAAPPSAAAGQRGPATPDLVCVEKATTVTLTGDGFTPMPSKTLEDSVRLLLPSILLTRTRDVNGGAVADAGIAVPDDPASPATSHVHWASEQQMSFDLTPDMKAPPGVYDIRVTNPDGNHAADFPGALAGFARATLSGIAPDIVCDADGDQTITVTGNGFLQIGTLLPIVRVGTQNLNASKVGGCKAVPGNYAEGAVGICTQVTFTVAKNLLPPGGYPVAVQNPAPADCDFSDPVTLTIAAPPSAQAIKEDLVCDAQAVQSMTVTGTGFLQIGAAQPTVTVTGTAGASKTYAATVDGCAAVPGKFTETPVSACTTLKFAVPVGDLPPDDYLVVVKNPATADCVSTEPLYFHVAPPPSLKASATVQVCDASGSPVVAVQGGSATGDFLKLTAAGGAVTYPTVTVNGGATYPATDASGCTEIKLPQGTFREGKVEECTSISFTLPSGALATGSYDVTVTNPPPAACSGKGSSELVVVPPPTVTKVDPPSMCVGGGNVTLTGTGLLASSTVSFGDPTGAQPSFTGTGATVNAGGTQLTTGIPPATGNPGTTYDVTVTDPGGCHDAAPHQKLTITAGPILYFVDPNVVYNGISTSVTLYVTSITGAVTSVVLTPQAGGAAITYTPGDATHPVNAVPGHPNRVQIVVPAGTATGAYDVTFADSLACPAQLKGGLTVTATKTITLKSIVPPFGAAATETPVTIFRDTAAVAPNNTPFRPTPRAFLNKHNATPTDVAIQLGSVSFGDDATLSAIVPANQPTGVYDLVVIDPSPGNEVGVLPNAFTVTVNPPPTITSVSPSSIVKAAGQPVVISGTNFRPGATATITQCTTSIGGAAPAPNGVTTGTLACSGSGCTLGATIDAGNLAGGDVCILRVQNTDGTFVDFSAIGVTNSSLNLSAPRAGTQMNFGRRGLVGAAANATDAARFVYAIGGDNGTASTPYKSVEAASVDPFGAIKAWSVLPYDLGTARSFAAGVTVGRYIYVCGGSDGTNALATCKRALVLSPTEAPSLQVADVVLATTGLAPGYWYYRVSAIFAAGDPDNPAGESLPSDEVILLVPQIGTKKIQIVLSWSAPTDSLGGKLPNVTGYRVYRTPMVNGVSGQEVLLADNVAGTSFVDDGTKAPGAAVPLSLGSTGQWASLPTMSVARSGLGMSFGFDPVKADTFYVYSFFGLNGAAANDSYEYLPVKVETNGHQTAGGSWTTGVSKTAAPRWQIGAWHVDSTVYTPAGTSTYVYVGGGIDAAGTNASTVEAGKVAAGGDLGTLVAGGAGSPVKNFAVEIAGYGTCAANGILFTFGGVSGVPGKKAKSAQLSSPQPGLASGAWNDEGLQTVDPLYLLGSAVQSSFIFLLGGETAAGPPIVVTKNTETVIW